MLTEAQEKWLSHLSNEEKIKIVPYDPKVEKIFKKIKKKIKSILGKNTRVVHRGATSLGISGQGEIDVYIPVPISKFNSHLRKLKQALGNAGSVYPLERARFNLEIGGFKAEIFLIKENSPGWKRGIAFEKYLKNHPRALETYQKLKERSDGTSVREYYRRKTEFINSILSRKES